MLKKEILDFLVVAVPHDQYEKIIKLAALKKIHILKEKPFARNLREALLFKQLSEKYGIYIMTAFQRRFHPLYIAFNDILKYIGEIKYIHADYTISSKNPNSGWRSNIKRAGGGVVLDMGYHIFDLLIWYFDSPDSINATMSICRKKEYNVEDTAQINFTIRNIKGSIFLSCIYPYKREEIIVLGENGSATLTHDKIERRNKNQEIVDVLKAPNEWRAAMINQIDYFLKVVIGEIPPKYSTPTFQIQNHVKLLEACYLSHKENRVVYLNEFDKKLL